LSSAASNGEAGRIGRFSLAGIANTAIGYAVIFAGLALGFSPYASNLAGYTVGLACSFLLNKYFVFAAPGGRRRQMGRFLAAFAIAYAANLALLHACLQAGIGGIVAQILAGVLYLGVMYALMRAWVFRKSPVAGFDRTA
jgi:putative flippase GtrA